MKMDKAKRVWTVVIPRSTQGNWVFIFYVNFEQTGTQQVVVRWRELSIGSGTFKLNHFGVCWGCLFQAFKRIERIAEAHAYDWSELATKCR